MLYEVHPWGTEWILCRWTDSGMVQVAVFPKREDADFACCAFNKRKYRKRAA